MNNDKKGYGCFTIFLLLCLLLSIGLNGILVLSNVKHSSISKHTTTAFQEEIVEHGAPGTNDKIALIEIEGIISSGTSGPLTDNMVRDYVELIRSALDDDNVKALILYLNSPGGEVTASDVIYNEVCKTESKKPIVIYMGSLAASGAYYIACGGTYLMASDTTLTGSIGVIIQTLNYKELFGKIGLKSITFKSGQFKDSLSGARDMTDKEKAHIQDLVMQIYDKFLGIVARERNLSKNVLKNTVADGRILSGTDAMREKLIDGLGYLEDAFDKARELAVAPGAAIIRYSPSFDLQRALRFLGQSESQHVKISITEELLPKLETGKLYLLPSLYTP